ncbi:M48 family metalloprotease [Natronolimnohabitans innermongolicus]|uniref:Peptidase M48 Ste24p n=1 Tax=Natronolimnohabitans innermongolicus JCM 12255 TaxID=1227499 RepID=L9WX32_9EURY|nr:M48 family metalloprotease [Natronolimnohabitans innermongolicus]ELY54000.1 peptidase M48 Ste24p [Natronolimnohabitans innermongolicus JCM 12255]
MSRPDDHALRLRMLVALGLLVVLPFAFVYTFVALANTVGIALLEWANERPYHGEFYVDPVLLAVVVLGGLVVQYRFGPRAVVGSVGGRSVDADAYPDLHATVTRLAAQVDVAKPDVAVVESRAPNAFAVAGGGDERVVVTSALLEELDDAELEAVLAHELAHLRNQDARLMTVAWLLPTITYYLAIAAFYVLYGFYRLLGHGFGGSSGGDSDGRGLLVAVVVITVTAVVTLTVSAMFWAASVLFYRVLSREREYAADRAAATITGSPAALASALETIDETMTDVPDRDLRRLDGGTEALYLAPLEGRDFASKELVSTDIFPDTHPPTAKRIERLRELARETE